MPEDKPLFSPVFSASLPIICLKISHIDGNMRHNEKEMIEHEMAANKGQKPKNTELFKALGKQLTGCLFLHKSGIYWQGRYTGSA